MAPDHNLMAPTLTEKIRTALDRYLADVRALPNESAEAHRFFAL